MNSNFTLKLQIKYETSPGQDIYVLGSIPELGNWKELVFKLKWTPGHIWERELGIPFNVRSFFYKFVCFDFGDKTKRWEQGSNRYFDRLFLPNAMNTNYHTLFCKWDYFVLTFGIYYPLEKEHEYLQIIGNHPTIGNWFKDNGTPSKMNLSNHKSLKNIDGRFWEVTVEIPNPTDTLFFEYRYSIFNPIKGTAIWEREPNRTLRIKTAFSDGDVSAYLNSANAKEEELLINNHIYHQDINFIGGLEFHKIGDFPIYIGPYPQNEDDIETLHSTGVTAVLNVQTDLDMAHRQVDWNANLNAYKKRNMTIMRHPIRDFDQNDLKKRLFEANTILKNLIDDGKVVYVHCTAGMSRAAATVIGYFCIYKDFELERAYDYTKSYRSVICPNMKVLEEVIEASRLVKESDTDLD